MRGPINEIKHLQAGFPHKIRRALRRHATQAEKLLWKAIRNSQLGYKFRRQFSIGTFIVDFYCRKLNLVIEVDGYTHNDNEVQAKDKEKQNYLESSPHPNPLPQGEGTE